MFLEATDSWDWFSVDYMVHRRTGSIRYLFLFYGKEKNRRMEWICSCSEWGGWFGVQEVWRRSFSRSSVVNDTLLLFLCPGDGLNVNVLTRFFQQGSFHLSQSRRFHLFHMSLCRWQSTSRRDPIQAVNLRLGMHYQNSAPTEGGLD